MKKINCKHGLTQKEEIEARRLRKVIEEGKNNVIEERLFKLYKSYGLKQITGDFYSFIKENDIVLYSAIERVGGIFKLHTLMRSFGLR